MTTARPHIKPIRDKLTAAAAACALLGAAGTLSACATSAAAAPAHASSPAALRAALRGDLSRFLHSRRTADRLSAVSLRVGLPGSRPAIALAPAAPGVLATSVGHAVAFMPRSALVSYVRRTQGLALCGRGATCPG